MLGIISDNINNVMTQVKEICEKKGQDYNNVTVIAVTKTIDTARIKEAIDSGITDIGENKVQEIMDKYEDVKDIANIHLIGHLQSNKIKYIIDRVKLIHSVDSLSLMKEIDKRAAKADVIANILIQVNVAEEESKFGIKMDEVEDFMIIASQYNNIRIKGLMTIAPYAENPEDVRLIFRALKEKYDKLTSEKYKNVEMKYLSMGMTNDYHVALEEGSNMVRIGTGIFGKRIYNR
ncbi:MAG: YggS family pyridoxal phosphate-dependent enzyme [Gottschalkiaceae bacterium]|nr:MAG: YggS family pyridoxal phosphate-dependent enzyme [Gottschalkiaceae bacterium]